MGERAPVRDRLDVMVFEHQLGDLDAVASPLPDFEILCATRERTPFRALRPIERPPVVGRRGRVTRSSGPGLPM
jgi:hypothetical protein